VLAATARGSAGGIATTARRSGGCLRLRGLLSEATAETDPSFQ
jgi:hypothetical protein